ncbi:MAG: DUF1579 family protein [Planctomycetota bacterium]|jgi:hypothetical protein
MTQQDKPMGKFNFLLGSWNMEYRIPKSAFSEAATGTSSGTFKRFLDDKYVIFDYGSSLTDEQGEAHGIFAWDKKAKLYRYWWFENSGNFDQATCNFLDDKALFMNWHDSLCVQSFRAIGPDKVVLTMEHPTSKGEYELVMEVIFTRK